jgi:hypothetical protein
MTAHCKTIKLYSYMAPRLKDIQTSQLTAYMREIRAQEALGQVTTRFLVDDKGGTTIALKMGETVTALDPKLAKEMATCRAK